MNTTEESEMVQGTILVNHHEVTKGQRAEATWHEYTADERQWLKKVAQKDAGCWKVQLSPSFWMSLRPRDFRPDSVLA